MTTTTWPQYYSTRWCRKSSLTTEKSLACCIAWRANTGILMVTTFVVKRSPHGSACRTSPTAIANPPLLRWPTTSWTGHQLNDNLQAASGPGSPRLSTNHFTPHLQPSAQPPTFAICQRCVWIFRRFNSGRLGFVSPAFLPTPCRLVLPITAVIFQRVYMYARNQVNVGL